MIDAVKTIDIKGKEYPILCDFNILESIQDKYGSLVKWENTLADVKVDEEKREINVKELKFILTEMLNEGIDDESKEKFTEKQVGKIISHIGLSPAYELVLDLVRICISGKNTMTTQSETVKNQNPEEK